MQDLHRIDLLLWQPLGLEYADGTADLEAKDYHGCTFSIGKTRIIYRKSKITPKKSGQFVTLWKRGQNGATEPFNANDDHFDCCIIAVEHNENFGVFVFPKHVLSRHGILQSGQKAGKRGFRLYSDFDITHNKQAQATRNWQKDFFIPFTDPNYAKEKFKSIFQQCST